jgi:ABC-type Fe3+ transport system permease subunit
MGIALPTAALATCYGLAAAQVTVRWQSASGRSLQRADKLADIVSISLLALSPTVLGFYLHASLGALGIRPFDYTYLGVIAIQSFLFTPLSFRIFYAALRDRVLDWNAQYSALSLPLGMQTLVVEWRALWAHVCAVFMINVSFSVGEVVGPALFGDTTFRPLSLLLLELVGSYQFDRAAIVTLLVLAIAFVAYAIGNRELQHARG